MPIRPLSESSHRAASAAMPALTGARFSLSLVGRVGAWLLLLLCVVPAQAKAASPDPVMVDPITKSFIFLFPRGSEVFMADCLGNSSSIQQVQQLANRYRQEIDAGVVKLRVVGYNTLLATQQENLKQGSRKANHVKSALVVRAGVREQQFRTSAYSRPYGSYSHAVVLTFYIPQDAPEGPLKEALLQQLGIDRSKGRTVYVDEHDHQEPAEEEVDETEMVAGEPEAVVVYLDTQPTAPPDTVGHVEFQPEPEQPAPVQREQAARRQQWDVRTNLLYWALATPNLGVEWRPAANVGIQFNGGYAPWKSDNWSRNLSLWYVVPELRWYIGQGWFIGGQYTLGAFNIKLTDTGRQGTLWAAGINGGYRMALSPRWDMDFSLGLGYASTHYDSYYHSDNGHNVIIDQDVRWSGFAPVQAGVGLIWKID